MSSQSQPVLSLDSDVMDVVTGIARACPGPVFWVDEMGDSQSLNDQARELALHGIDPAHAFISPVGSEHASGRVIGYPSEDADVDEAATVSAVVALIAEVFARGGAEGKRRESGARSLCIDTATEILAEARIELGRRQGEEAAASVLVRAAAGALEANAAVVFVSSEDGERLETLAVEGIPASELRPSAMSGGLLGWAAQQDAPFVIRTYQELPAMLSATAASPLEPWFELPMALLPLRSGPASAGLLCLTGLPRGTANSAELGQALTHLELLADRTAATLAGTRLGRHQQRSARVGRELDIARQIQACLLPQGEFETEELEWAGACRAAAVVSGDWFGHELDDAGRLTTAICDVAGHGIGAAVGMTMVRSVLSGALAEAEQVATALTSANEEVSAELGGTGLYATAFVARFDLAAGRLDYGSAGHSRPIHWSAGQRSFLDHGEGGVPLGLLGDSRYRPASAPLAIGDVFVTYTDGVVEARDAQGRPFGRARLMAAVNRLRGKSARAILKGLWRALDDHVGELPLPDDSTLTVVRMKPRKPSLGTDRISALAGPEEQSQCS